MSTVRIYTRGHQPATRYLIEFGSLGRLGRRWCLCKPGRLIWTACCRKRRPAKNLTVQVYYDMTPFWCRPGTGCKAPSRRKRVANLALLREFHSGLSPVGLARKYGLTNAEVQRRLRNVMTLR